MGIAACVLLIVVDIVALSNFPQNSFLGTVRGGVMLGHVLEIIHYFLFVDRGRGRVIEFSRR